jgi:hypothetical protein
MAEPAAKLVNEAFLDRLMQGGEMAKQASDAVTDYIRVRVREDGFYRRIQPPITITNDQLDRQVDTDKPVKIVDMEPQSPAAISVPFGQMPENIYVGGPKCRVMFDRIITPKFTKDVDELRTYDMDIRQILSDNSIKDMLAEEDGKFIGTVNSLLGAAGSTVSYTGTVQNIDISGGVTRDTVADAMKVLPSTPNHLNCSTVLVNNVTIWDVVKWNRNEVGGDLSQELLINGFAERQIMGRKWIITIKRDLVPDSTIFMFAEPKFLGKFYVLEDTTMYIDRKAFMLEFFAYESIGAIVANVAAVARANFK